MSAVDSSVSMFGHPHLPVGSGDYSEGCLGRAKAKWKNDLQLVGTAEPMCSYMESRIPEEGLARGMARQKLLEQKPSGHTNLDRCKPG